MLNIHGIIIVYFLLRLVGVSTNFHIDYPFCRQTVCTEATSSIRLLPGEIARESSVLHMTTYGK
jgi:hypothetical protein